MTDRQSKEEQCDFNDGQGCEDQLLILKMLAEKFSEKKKDVLACFLGLEKVWDKIQTEILWRVLEIYGINRLSLKVIKSLYRKSRAFVRSKRRERKGFEGGVGLRQDCVI